MFPVVVGGLITLFILLQTGCVVHFVVEQLLTCIVKIIWTTFSIFVLEFCKFVNREYHHLGQLLRQLMTLVGILLVIIVTLEFMFLIWTVNLYVKLKPDFVFEVWTGFAMLYSSVMGHVIRCCKSKSLQSFATRVHDIPRVCELHSHNTVGQ